MCDGSLRSGLVKILDETYANCIDQTSSHLFYAVTARKNLLAFGADISNAFTEALPPKQGFYLQPDKAFHDWWVNHKYQPPIPPNHVIPALSAMQGHPEAPRLWEKHSDAILHGLRLTPTVHEACLYLGTIESNQIVFKRQVDDFAIAASDECTTNILLDMIDDELSIPLKRQGLLDTFNGINVTLTKYYIKINCHTYINKFCKKYLATWLNKVHVSKNQPTTLPTDTTWIKKFNVAIDSTDPTKQHRLTTKMQIRYKGGVKIDWARSFKMSR